LSASESPLEQKASLGQRTLAFLKRYRSQVLALSISVAITVVVVHFADSLRNLAGLGYLGVFAVAVLSNATVILPVPGIAVVFASGGVFNPLLVALIAGVGEPLGELSGYLAGYAGSPVIENRELFTRVRGFMEKHGFLTLFVLSAVPNPLFDLAGITAGMLHVPVGRFLLACWLGKTVKSLAVAYLGNLSLGRLIG